MACSPAVAEAVATARFSGGSVGDQDEEGLVRRQVAEEVVRKADQLQCGIRTHTSLDRRATSLFWLELGGQAPTHHQACSERGASPRLGLLQGNPSYVLRFRAFLCGIAARLSA